MTLFHIAILAVVQGITEFWPISSSAHLILVPALTGWPDQGLTIDIAVHVGTLGAVAAYLWRDLWNIVLGLFRLLTTGRLNPWVRLLGLLILATVPVVIAGYLMNYYLGGNLRSIEVIAWTTLGFGVLLYFVDRASLTVRRLEHMAMPAAVFVGFSQILALVPGTSRAGITITAARLLGFERRDAARFSMLLSIPTILGAGTLKGAELLESGDLVLGLNALTALGLSFVVALAAVAAMMAWLREASFGPFVFYRVVLGLLLLYWIYRPEVLRLLGLA